MKASDPKTMPREAFPDSRQRSSRPFATSEGRPRDGRPASATETRVLLAAHWWRKLGSSADLRRPLLDGGHAERLQQAHLDQRAPEARAGQAAECAPLQPPTPSSAHVCNGKHPDARRRSCPPDTPPPPRGNRHPAGASHQRDRKSPRARRLTEHHRPQQTPRSGRTRQERNPNLRDGGPAAATNSIAHAQHKHSYHTQQQAPYC